MSDAMPSMAEVFNAVVRDGITAVLKPSGFRKKSTNFHRRLGRTVQVVNVQSSSACTREQKLFYINVGIAFDDICDLVGEPILDHPRESECDPRGRRERLEKLLTDVPDCWRIDAHTDVATLTEHLHAAMAVLVHELDTIHGPADYRTHTWFDLDRPRDESPQIFYLLGDLESARQEVVSLTKRFADRSNARNSDWWIQRLGLKKLQP